MKISIIAALDSKHGIGKNGDLLFKIPEDFKRMKDLSMGHPIIMGRKTYESIGKPLPGRTNIVLTHNTNLARSHLANLKVVNVVLSLEEAIEVAKKSPGAEEIFIFGGGEIFKQVMDKVDKLYLTLVEGDFNADTFFPEYPDFRKVVYEKDGEFNGLKYKFLDLER